MRQSKWLLMSIFVGCLGALNGCGGGSSSPSSNGVAAPISIAFEAAPPKAMTINNSLKLAAKVTNDPNEAGVDWSISCGTPNNCGALNVPHTDSGADQIYFPPTTFNGNSQAVTIVAFATADHTKNVLASVTVSAFAGVLKGRYVFHTKGSNSDPATGILGPFQMAGVVALDGNGGVALSSVGGVSIGGEQTWSDSSAVHQAQITGGSYFVGADGRGTLTLNTLEGKIPGIETFAIAVVSSKQVLVVENDGAAYARGGLDTQSSSAAPTGGYAFSVFGSDVSNFPIAYGGVINIDQAGGVISGNGSVTDEFYQSAEVNCPAPLSPGDPVGLSGTVSAPDAFGAVVFNLAPCFNATPIQLTGYIVDAAHIQFVETDINAGAGTGFATGGVAIGQGKATGTFTNFAGTYAFGLSGIDQTTFDNSLTAAGRLTADGAGNISGNADEYMLSGIAVTDGLTAPYIVDPAGTGRVDVFVAFNSPASPPGPEYILYQTGPGSPVLVLDFDVNLLAEGSGIAYPATANPTFSGAYSMGLSQMVNFGIETVLGGQMSADTTTSTLSGNLDGLFITSAPLTGTFNPPSAGQFSGTLTDESASGSSLQASAPMDFYLIDNTQGFFVETDLAQTTLGYFTRRTPVCSSCQ